MANRNMTYKIAMWLDSSQVGKGAAKAKSALQGLKSTILSMTAALVSVNTISGVFRKMAETAKDLSTARIVLENVSKSTVEFANNQQFVNRLSKDYKQDVIALTQGFAQFKAASDAANVSLEDSKKIYESLTRAAAYYNLSSEQTSNMMNAVVQMMSKGKVAAEELRRQLGNAIPGAVAIMQKSLGVTSAEFEKMLKDGKLMSAEVLPKFADELNNITKDLKITSLQSSLNELKNTFTDLVNNVNIEGFAKRVTTAFNSILTKVNQLISKLKGNNGLLDLYGEVAQQQIAIKIKNGEKLTGRERRFLKDNPLTKNGYQESIILGEDGNYHESYRRSDKYGIWGNWIEKAVKSDTSGSTGTGGGGNGTTVQSQLSKELDKYKKSQSELDSQYKNGAISEAKYTEEMAKLNDKTWLAISGISNLADEINRLKSGDRDIIGGIQSGFNANRESEAAKAKAEAQKQADANVDAILESYSSALGKTLGKRDTKFDFKKSDTEILGENAEYWTNQVEQLQNLLDLYDELLTKYPQQQGLIDVLFADINSQLDEAIANADNFNKALTLQEYQDYVKELNKDFKSATYEGIKDAAEGVDRLTRGFKALKDTMEDSDSSAWEKILAVINEIIQAFETVNSVMAAFNSIQEISNALKKASTVNIMADAGAKMVDASATETLASAEAKEAAAAGAGSVAKIPVVGALMAVGAVGAIVAAITGAFGKFATGGIVGGSSYNGDKKFVKVNSGEMILNRGQQANLYDFINKGGGNSGNVQFKISGKDLVGVFQNYNQQRKG